MPIQTPLYPHAFVIPEADTWTIAPTVIGAGATLTGPTMIPAAVVNPNTATEVASGNIPSVGHILTALVWSTIVAPAFQAIFEFRFPLGTGTWHTMATVNFVSATLIIDNALSIYYLPCVPNFRMKIFNPGGVAGSVEGALTLYSL